MALPALDRTSIRFSARKLDTGINVNARFSAPKLSTGEPGAYRVHMRIDPHTRGMSIVSIEYARNGSTYHVLHRSGTNELRRLAEQVRDHVLKSKAWSALTDRAPDHRFIVDHEGNVRIRERTRELSA